MSILEAKISILDGIILLMLVYGDKASSNISSYLKGVSIRGKNSYVLKIVNNYYDCHKTYSMYYTSSSAVEIPLFMFLSLAEQISKKHTERG